MLAFLTEPHSWRMAGPPCSLELLLSTPMTVPDILRGHLLALRRQFIGPVLAVLGFEVTFMFASLHDASYRDASSSVAVWVLSMLMLVLDMVALSWVGMWVALAAKNPNRATGITVLRVLVLPMVVLVCAGNHHGRNGTGGIVGLDREQSAWPLVRPGSGGGFRVWNERVLEPAKRVPRSGKETVYAARLRMATMI